MSLYVNFEINMIFIDNNIKTKGEIAMNLIETKSENASMVETLNVQNTNNDGARGCMLTIERHLMTLVN